MIIRNHLKVGDSNVTCNLSSGRGTLKYVNNDLLFCDGAAWESMIGPPNAIYIWVTVNNLDGRITHGADVGIDAAHKICEDDAISAGLPTALYTHRAILASTSF